MTNIPHQLNSNEDSKEPVDNHAVGGLIKELQRGGESGDLRFVARVMARITHLATESIGIQALQAQLKWLSMTRVWKIAAMCTAVLFLLTGIYALPILSLHAAPMELKVLSHGQFEPGKLAPIRAFVYDPRSQEPIVNATVNFFILQGDKVRQKVGMAKTDSDGSAVADLDLKGFEEGTYSIRAIAQVDDDKVIVDHSFKVARSFRILLTTDKPIYQPGQKILIRSLTLRRSDQKPMKNEPVSFFIEDPNGNKVFRKELTTSKFGIAATAFELASQVNLGNYIITIKMGDTSTQKTVMVTPYVLPKFHIGFKADKPWYRPSDTVSGKVSTKYHFGKAVPFADVKVFPDSTKAICGKTDQNGDFNFKWPINYRHTSGLENGVRMLDFRIVVTDSAGQSQTVFKTIKISKQPIIVATVPESGKLIPGVSNKIYIITRYPDGRPARTTITHENTHVKSDESGVAVIEFTPEQSDEKRNRGSIRGGQGVSSALRQKVKFSCQAVDTAGQKGVFEDALYYDSQPEAFLVRSDHPYYKSGDSMTIQILSPKATDRIFVDLVKDRQCLLMKTIDVKNHQGKLVVDLSAEMVGTLQIHAYRVKTKITDYGFNSQNSGSFFNVDRIVRDACLVRVGDADGLQISINKDRQSYRPGETAVLDFSLTNKQGEAAPGALSLAAVDKTVFSMSAHRPGFERLYFGLQSELLDPKYPLFGMSSVPMQIKGDFAKISPPNFSNYRKSDLIDNPNLWATIPHSGLSSNNSRPFTERDRLFNDNRNEAGVILVISLLCGPLILLLICFFILVKFLYRTFSDEPEFTEDGLDGCFFMSSLDITLNDLIKGLIWCGFVPMNPYLMYFGYSCYEEAKQLKTAGNTISSVRFAKASRLLCLTVPLSCLSIQLLALTSFISGSLLPWIFIPLLLILNFINLLMFRMCTQHYKAGRGWFVSLFMSANHIATKFPVLLVVFYILSLLMTLVAGAFSCLGSGENGLMNLHNQKVYELELSQFSKGKQGVEDQKQSRVRRDFPETLYWNPQVITGEDGKVQVKIPLADSITTWRLSATAVNTQGKLGIKNTDLVVFQPFFVDINLPVSLTQNDEVEVPVILYNYLDKSQKVRLEIKKEDWFELKGDTTKQVSLNANEVKSQALKIKVLKPGKRTLLIRAFGNQVSDAIARGIEVKPDGKQIMDVYNGTLEKPFSAQITIPQNAVEDGSDLFAKIYVNRFSQIVEGLDSILKRPHGCFEQTSSATYPNVLALNYMRAHNCIQPEVEMKAMKYINTGYQRLLTFESKEGGFSWFGSGRSELYITAYGLMEFADMAKVYDIDSRLISRTSDYVLSKQRFDGSWPAKSSRTSTLTGTCYIAMTLVEAGTKGVRLKRALDYIVKNRSQIKDNYTLALATYTLAAAGRYEASEFLEMCLSKVTERDGLCKWSSTGRSIMYGYGRSVDVETTSLIAMACLKVGHHKDLAFKALKWIVSVKDPRGAWYSTQSTIMASKALLAGIDDDGKSKSCKISIMIDGKQVHQLTIDTGTNNLLQLVDLKKLASKGSHYMQIVASPKRAVDVQVVSVYYQPYHKTSVVPVNTTPLTINVRYSAESITMKEDLMASCEVQNNLKRALNMTMVDLAIPPGFKVSTVGLDKLKATKVIERYDISGSKIIIYLKAIEAETMLAFQYKLIPTTPVKGTIPASKVWQYYQPEVQNQTKPVKIEVKRN